MKVLIIFVLFAKSLHSKSLMKQDVSKIEREIIEGRVNVMKWLIFMWENILLKILLKKIFFFR